MKFVCVLAALMCIAMWQPLVAHAAPMPIVDIADDIVNVLELVDNLKTNIDVTTNVNTYKDDDRLDSSPIPVIAEIV